MHLRKLAAASAATGAVALGLGLAAPANAAALLPQPKVTVSPNPFTPGARLNLAISACDDAPKTVSNQIFAAAPAFTKSGAGWAATAQAKSTLKAGQTYTTKFSCTVKDETQSGTANFGLTTSIPKQPPKAEPKFKFGFDKVQLSTRRVMPGSNITFRVKCPNPVSATSASWATAPSFKKTGTDTWTGTGRFKSSLPAVVNIKVSCKGFGFVTYSTKPGKRNVGDGGGTGNIPTGPGPNTGDGSLFMQESEGSNMALIAGGSAGALAVAGLGTVLVRRRRTGQESA